MNPTSPMVALNQVRYQCPNGKQPVLSIDDFSINASERVFLQGPSGSGKTTLLRSIAGLLKNHAAQVT